jgi:predicted amidohydrolase YtcJ
MNQLFTVYSAVNRITRSGKVLGKEQCISAYQALQAITIHAAYQYFEEKSKGSLEQGKLADFIVLDQNPLKVEPLKIKDVQVLMTFKEGKLIYKK